MAAMETFWGWLLASLTAVVTALFGWAWQLSQRVAILETEMKATQRFAEQLNRVETKIDRAMELILGRRDG